MFSEYFDAGFVNEGQFVLEFYRKLPSYGDLSKPAHLRRFLQDMLHHRFFSILSRAYRIEVTPEIIIERIGEPTYAGIVYAVFEFIAFSLNKKTVGNKETDWGLYLDVIVGLFPQAKIVHIIRDGRDCALSHFGQSWGIKNVYVAALEWAEYVRKARDYGQTLGPPRYFEFRYEDMCTQPEEVFPRLQAFVTGTSSAEATARFVEENNKSPLATNFNKWQSQLSLKQQQIFETVAGSVLRELDYPCRGYAIRIPAFMRVLYYLHDRCMKRLCAVARKRFNGVRAKQPVGKKDMGQDRVGNSASTT